MLQIKSISKQYRTGDLVQRALDDVSLVLRDNEFVAILGPSGSGKTTLLNIIGGLDRYDSGDLIINDISTKQYKDRDWDSYRNHTIGFVFQSYNLIPHQSVLSNVELALTISGISGGERRRRAKEALEKVGLGDQLHKRPNQMSGGQMQRVAIARALVNDPDILLADEPTGALDTETSVQVMELLKEVARDRLVVMVTHNPELAENYATRIVRLRDGKITDDSDPVRAEEISQKEAKHQNMGKSSMSYLTALSLSFNNLLTKKGRTLLTAFAGSIGIIGIALILSLSTGVNKYIDDIQKEAMTSYPITLQAQTIDLSSMIATTPDEDDPEEVSHGKDGIYSNSRMLKAASAMTTSIEENNLSAFKAYLDDPDSEIHQYIGENGITYSYNTRYSVFTHDPEGVLINTDQMASSNSALSMGANTGMSSMSMSSMSGTMSTNGFEEILPGSNGELISPAIKDSYELVYGDWPSAYDEIVLVVNRNNEVMALRLYALGVLPASEYKEAMLRLMKGEEAEVEDRQWTYEEFCSKPYYLVPACDLYEENGNGTFTDISGENGKIELLLEQALQLKITGVIRLKEDADFTPLTQAFGYTKALTDYLIEYTLSSPVVQAQMEQPDINVLSGVNFVPAGEEEKIEDAKAYLAGLGTSEKAKMCRDYLGQMNGKAGMEAVEAEESTGNTTDTGDHEIPEKTAQNEGPGVAGLAGIIGRLGGIFGMGNAGSQAQADAQDPAAQSGDTTDAFFSQGTAAGSMSMMGSGQLSGMMEMDESQLAALFDSYMGMMSREMYLSVYNTYVSAGSYEENMTAFGVVSVDTPSEINIYADSFEDKDFITGCITKYNETVSEEDRISYTDYVALLMSSITTIINVISYVLIAFVAVSLVVSSIMIGIITYISVLERTKEIGILRAIGASKRNISQVFNAETIIIGLCAGLIGIGVTLLLLIPGNAIIHSIAGSNDVSAILPVNGAVVLVVLSVILTMLGGLIPSRAAAKKDPVTALRTE